MAKGLSRLEQLALEDGKLRRQLDQIRSVLHNNATLQD